MTPRRVGCQPIPFTRAVVDTTGLRFHVLSAGSITVGRPGYDRQRRRLCTHTTVARDTTPAIRCRLVHTWTIVAITGQVATVPAGRCLADGRCRHFPEQRNVPAVLTFPVNTPRFAAVNPHVACPEIVGYRTYNQQRTRYCCL